MIVIHTTEYLEDEYASKKNFNNNGGRRRSHGREFPAACKAR